MTKAVSIKVENEQLDKGSVEITKIDKDSQKVLEGVVFEVQDEQGKLVTEVKTDKDGKSKNLRSISRKVQISRDEKFHQATKS
ncbi:MSCRAMM family protein [Bacillus cereus]